MQAACQSSTTTRGLPAAKAVPFRAVAGCGPKGSRWAGLPSLAVLPLRCRLPPLPPCSCRQLLPPAQEHMKLHPLHTQFSRSDVSAYCRAGRPRGGSSRQQGCAAALPLLGPTAAGSACALLPRRWATCRLSSLTAMVRQQHRSRPEFATAVWVPHRGSGGASALLPSCWHHRLAPFLLLAARPL